MTDLQPVTPDTGSKKSFGRDVGKLVSGTVIAQVVGICLTPVITYIFSPEIYGVASTFISIVSIIAVIACMRYELAILLPKDNTDAGAVFLACLIILVCVSLLSIFVMFFFGDSIAGRLNQPTLAQYLYLIPVAVLIDGLYTILRYWNTRRTRFGTQAATQALQSSSASGLKLGFGIL
ncbi:MAG: oligosaccharide flippase family protein, partial [Methanocorpusculum sp.]|nr:oligosaccharide flippase family protein [Methanocorpusculum sp.]